jgi:DNA-binding NtrC family response regulator
MKIIIVDDNVSMRKVLAALFQSQGHQVVASLEDGSQLAKSVKEFDPDLVCLDQNMPGKSGLELLKELSGELSHLDVVMITGSDDPKLVGQSADAGAVGFLHKPFSQEQIINELKHVEESRKVMQKGADPEAEGDAPAMQRYTAIVVDDNGSMRMLLKGILEGMGVKVLESLANGRSAIDAAKQHQPNIVCLDVDMPIMSGLEALPQIMEQSPQTKVVMITGNATRDIVDAAVQGGAKAYVIKPLRPAHVEGCIRKLLTM